MSSLAPAAFTFDVLILSNGPGELTTWVRPVVLELREQVPQARISVMLSPCPHASGQEMSLLRSAIQVDRAQDADAFWTFMLTGQTEEAWDWLPRGVVVFLGGDQFYAVWAAWRLGYRTVVYAEEVPRWQIWVDAFGIRDQSILERYGGFGIFGGSLRAKMQVVGDLMADGVASAAYVPGVMIQGWTDRGPAPLMLPKKSDPASTLLLLDEEWMSGHEDEDWDPTREDITSPEIGSLFREKSLLPQGWQRLAEPGRKWLQVGILPGSKPAKLSLGVPLMLAVADQIRRQYPLVRFVLPVAPTVGPRQLASYALPRTNPDMSLVYGTSGVLEQTSLGYQLLTPYGTTIQVWPTYPAYSVLAQCDLCITTVGANTAELARLSVPMIVVIPLNKPDVMRAWGGILGLLANMPGVGSYFAQGINWVANRILGYLAWPNIWAKAEVVPELRRHLRPEEVADLAVELLRDPDRRAQMREQLRILGGKPGAAQALVKLIEQQLAKAKPRRRKSPSPKSRRHP